MDCGDSDPDVYPGRSYFEEDATKGGGYDWNCDGRDERESARKGGCSYSSRIKGCVMAAEGWYEGLMTSGVPDCGETRAWIDADDDCEMVPIMGGVDWGLPVCRAVEGRQAVQRCR
jgi:hypothetical protein